MKQYQGVTTLEAYLDNQEKEKGRMRYSKYKLNEDGYPTKCPRFENEELDNDAFCNVCRLYAQNICIGVWESNYDNWGNLIPIQSVLNDGCHKTLAGNSRYCPDCGGKSTYFYQGLLKNWDIEKKEHDEFQI